MDCPMGGGHKVNCTTTNCAWWSKDNKKCAILLFAEKQSKL